MNLSSLFHFKCASIMASTSSGLNLVYITFSGIILTMGPSVVKPMKGLLITSKRSVRLFSFMIFTRVLYMGLSFWVSGSHTNIYCLFTVDLLVFEYIHAGIFRRHEYNIVVQYVLFYHVFAYYGMRGFFVHITVQYFRHAFEFYHKVRLAKTHAQTACLF